MKKFIVFVLLITLLACGNNDPLATVPELKTEGYAGKWYEIQCFPHSFEEDLQCVTAEYTLNNNGENHCSKHRIQKWRNGENRRKSMDSQS